MIRRTLLAVLAVAALSALAQNAERGRHLYQTYCTDCHYERLHERTRERSLVRSFADLRVEVARRAQLTGHRLTLEDLDDIAEYLNRQHYRFEK